MDTPKFDPKYYSLTKLLSRNKLMNFVIGNRGGGKSFAAKRWGINGWLKNRKQWFYIRRYNTEFEAIQNYFSDIEKFYPDHKFEASEGKFWIDGEVAGYYAPLSTSQNLKSNSYPDVDKIIYDEFIIIETSTKHYLKNEVMLFLDLYETIARMRDVTVLMISNAITVINPYFTYFHLLPRNGMKFLTVGECCVELYKGEAFTKEKKQTKFGKLIDGTRYGCYNIDNEFYNDNYSFIEKMPGGVVPWCSIVYIGQTYNVWYSPDKGYIYFNKKAVPSSCPKYCVTTQDHDPNYVLLKNLKRNPYFKDIRMCYEIGFVRFDTLDSKQTFYDIVGLI